MRNVNRRVFQQQALAAVIAAATPRLGTAAAPTEISSSGTFICGRYSLKWKDCKDAHFVCCWISDGTIIKKYGWPSTGQLVVVRKTAIALSLYDQKDSWRAMVSRPRITSSVCWRRDGGVCEAKAS